MKPPFLLPLAKAMWLLIACLGGQAAAQTAAKPAAAMQREVPAPSYPEDSPQAKAFHFLNQQLAHCGFGKLRQNEKLDQAILGHAIWYGLGGSVGHYQTKGSKGFTGASPEDRMAAAQYALAGHFVGSEVLSYSSVPAHGPASGYPDVHTWGVRDLLSGPYHAAIILSGMREAGLFVGSPWVAAGTIPAEQALSYSTFIKTAYTAEENNQNLGLGQSDVLTFPCEGSTNIEPALRRESPNPVPGRDLQRQPLGASVHIVVRPGQRLSLTSASMVESSGRSIPMRPAIDSTTDPHGHMQVRFNQAFVSPDTPLKPGTRYTVTLSGTNDGQAFSRSFTFTTACLNPDCQ